MTARQCGNCKYCGSGDNEYPCNDCYYGAEPLDTTPLRWTPKAEPVVTVVTKEDNPVTHPSHYTQGGIECIEAMEAAFGKEAVEHFCICNAFKYVWRSSLKNGKEDIEKAKWYLNKYEELKYSE